MKHCVLKKNEFAGDFKDIALNNSFLIKQLNWLIKLNNRRRLSIASLRKMKLQVILRILN